MRHRSIFAAAPLAALALAGCTNRASPPAGDAGASSGEVSQLIPGGPDIDLLLVLDNSASTSDKQTVLAQNFPKLVAALDAFPGGRPNLHIGVVDTTVDIGTNKYAPGCPSPDPADNGKLQDTPRVSGCTAQNGAYIVDVASGSGREANYSGTLDVALSCIAQVGATGCGYSAPLEAMKLALDGSNPSNSGFLRPDAVLAIVILTDEDDFSAAGSAVFSLPDGQKDPSAMYSCDQPISQTMAGTYTDCVPNLTGGLVPPASFAQVLASVKPPGLTVVGVLAGPPPGLVTNDDPPLTDTFGSDSIMVGPVTTGSATTELAIQPSCMATINNTETIARPAIRVASFLGDFLGRTRFYSICQSDYSPMLTDFAKQMYDAAGPCLHGPVVTTDIDPVNPGTQLDCTVADVSNIVTPTQSETIIPACAMTDATHPAPSGARPCWWVANDASACPAPDSGFELEIERAVPAPSGDVVQVVCAATP